jgi:hypothetical protein
MTNIQRANFKVCKTKTAEQTVHLLCLLVFLTLFTCVSRITRRMQTEVRPDPSSIVFLF